MNVTARRPRIKAWIPITVALLLVAGVGLATTTYVSAADVEAKASEGAFDKIFIKLNNSEMYTFSFLFENVLELCKFIEDQIPSNV